MSGVWIRRGCCGDGTDMWTSTELLLLHQRTRETCNAVGKGTTINNAFRQCASESSVLLKQPYGRSVGSTMPVLRDKVSERCKSKRLVSVASLTMAGSCLRPYGC